ncbi:hypothetical protein HMPREF3151_05065 [Corynebacterium sp. HMSC05H05]|uniref:hypothetical protein n=1 Tax=unclassified Corynebacterium TaxID=2624378 RepID=UPI0008A27C44|nr:MULTISPECIES: hypothetical protein [unclassified Corynebacterium]OFT58188.1 hypothetical protein HMPREF3151_05065 [Corynebacterium sp. HMSC05H05]OHR19136.1 hypothetical protein HMPREF2791_03065 [Corynebacterium sp. HMSC034A01]
MRNFRTAAVASATALTVLAGGTAIASAEDAQNETTSKDKAVVFVGKQEGDKDFGKVVSDGTKGLFDGKGSSQYFDDKDKEFYPTDAFGNKTNKEDVPQWARYWIDGSIVAAIGALVGLVIAGFNFAFYNGWIQHPLSR